MKPKKYIKVVIVLFLSVFVLSSYLQTERVFGAAETAPKIPKITADYKVFNQKATITYQVDSKYKMKDVKYLRGSYTNPDNSKWETSAKDITGKDSFTVTKSGNYSIKATDTKGNTSVYKFKVTLEFRAVWIAYYDFDATKGKSKQAFTAAVNQMFDRVKEQKMNAVVVHVRPFGDAMYPSKYYPWSKYASGTQGVNPGYDPLEIMVAAAHDRNLEFHAWLNPYRIARGTTDVTTLAADNPARKWLEDSDPENDRNILFYGGNIYYNPSSIEVRKLITNGIKEIVKKYDVDGIHFDDYFYPEWFGSDYASVFDAKEYNAYKASVKNPMSIVEWRRYNVNKLVRNIYRSIKKIDNTVQFGISPGGFLDYLLADDRYYVDFPTWLSQDGYIDYICPQLYWSFSKKNKFPYQETLDRWLSYRTSSKVKVYVGVGVYKVGIVNEDGWTKENILKEMVLAGRATKKVDGFIFFDYADMVSKSKQKAVDQLISIME